MLNKTSFEFTGHFKLHSKSSQRIEFISMQARVGHVWGGGGGFFGDFFVLFTNNWAHA